MKHGRLMQGTFCGSTCRGVTYGHLKKSTQQECCAYGLVSATWRLTTYGGVVHLGTMKL